MEIYRNFVHRGRGRGRGGYRGQRRGRGRGRPAPKEGGEAAPKQEAPAPAQE